MHIASLALQAGPMAVKCQLQGRSVHMLCLLADDISARRLAQYRPLREEDIL